MGEVTGVEIDGWGVATLWLKRPEKHNALSRRMIDEIHSTALSLGDNSEVRVVVLAAEGRTFCAGGDLAWMQEQIAADAKTRRREAHALADMLAALNRLPKPLIGRVQGNAFGGGVGLMSVCDSVIAADKARFGLTETRLGLIPATIGPYVLERIGASQARRVFYSSAPFDSAMAVRLGLVSEAVASETLDSVVEREVRPYLDCAPGAVSAAKAMTRRLGADVSDEVLDATIDALVAQWESPEALEGITAFFEKRRPYWAPEG